MTRLEKRCIEVAARECGLKEATLNRLYEAGLLDIKAAERLGMRRQVEALGRAGAGRCEAMLLTAEEWGCSYEKVRSATYRKHP